MTQVQILEGIPTKEKANKIAKQMRLLYPKWTVELIGDSSPYSVRSIPPETPTSNDSNISNEGIDSEVMIGNSSNRIGILGFLDFIAQYESQGNYNARYGAVTNTNEPDFTSLTIDEVLTWQKDRKFSACGKYQIIRQTLSGLSQTLGLSGNEIFNVNQQDAMGEKLLKKRGLEKFIAGTISQDEFAFSVAHEWAALPGVKEPHGEKSVYAGDGVNHALVSVSTYLSAIDKLKTTA